jgi:hypothetical protein
LFKPELNVEILGVNRVGMEPFSPWITNALPWLQDTPQADVWGSWKVAYRDLHILNGQNELIGVYNLTDHDLQRATNRIELFNILVAASKVNDAATNGLPDDWEYYYFKRTGVSTRADFDQDGVNNFAEYAFGLNPADDLRGEMFQTKVLKQGAQPNFSFSFRRRAGSILNYTVESTGDFKQWSALTAVPTIQNLYDGTGTSRATYLLPKEPNVPRFFRVKASTR